MNKEFFKINHKINLLDILDILDIPKDTKDISLLQVFLIKFLRNL